MGEIKSTLDIVLEKTKHLTLDREERRLQAQEEVQKKMKGLVQKFLDQSIRIDQLESELNHLQASYGSDCRKALLAEINGRLDLNQDNSQLFFMLNRLCRYEPSLLEKELNRFQNEIQLLQNAMTGTILQNLSEKFNLSGTAIVPNLENNEEWKTEVEEIRNKFKIMKEDQLKG